MDALRKPLAIVLGLMATAVLLHFVFTPFYQDIVDPLSIWHVLNWVMAVGVVLTLIVTYLRKRKAGDNGNSTNHFCVALAFYAAAALAVLFFWNWFDDLTAGEDGQSQTRRNYWVFINTLFILLMGSVSAHLWKKTS